MTVLEKAGSGSVEDFDFNAVVDAITTLQNSGVAVLGSSVVRGPYSFAFNTPGLADGVTVYTPTVNDLLVGGFIVQNSQWNGTTPTADVGTFVGTTHGILQITGVGESHLDESLTVPGTGMTLSKAGIGEGGVCLLITAANPVKLVVSQEGTKGGTPIDSSQGSARLYLWTATPVAL